jgi:hypothetical protein
MTPHPTTGATELSDEQIVERLLEKLFGWTADEAWQGPLAPDYNFAGKVIEAMHQRDEYETIEYGTGYGSSPEQRESLGYICRWRMSETFACADTFPRAVCLAAIAALEKA